MPSINADRNDGFNTDRVVNDDTQSAEMRNTSPGQSAGFDTDRDVSDVTQSAQMRNILTPVNAPASTPTHLSRIRPALPLMSRLSHAGIVLKRALPMTLPTINEARVLNTDTHNALRYQTSPPRQTLHAFSTRHMCSAPTYTCNAVPYTPYTPYTCIAVHLGCMMRLARWSLLIREFIGPCYFAMHVPSATSQDTCNGIYFLSYKCQAASRLATWCAVCAKYLTSVVTTELRDWGGQLSKRCLSRMLNAVCVLRTPRQGGATVSPLLVRR
jgi:hypothetical protein